MIINASDEATWAELFHQARAHGIDRPVLMTFESGPQATAVYTQLFGQPLKRKGAASGDEFRVLAHTAGEAAAALRERAGLGGRLVANFLESATPAVEGWYVNLSADAIGVIPIRNGHGEGFGSAHYDRLPHTVVCRCCAHKPGPLPLAVPVDGDVALFLQLPGASQ